MAEALYRITIEVFDQSIVVTERRVGGRSLSDEVARLAQLHESGALSEDEFTAAKRRVLGPEL